MSDVIFTIKKMEKAAPLCPAPLCSVPPSPPPASPCRRVRLATMTQTLKTLLVVACVVSLRPVLAAAEGDADGAVAEAEPRYITHAEKGG